MQKLKKTNSMVFFRNPLQTSPEDGDLLPPPTIPIKCLMEFPAHQVYSPHNHYRSVSAVYAHIIWSLKSDIQSILRMIQSKMQLTYNLVYQV